MEPQIGTILEGKVTTITKFGAFVALEGGKSGLVHISEIANAFVSDVNDFLQTGQTVKVLVLGNENGKINLSIKKALPQEERPARAPRPPRPAAPRENAPRDNGFRSGGNGAANAAPARSFNRPAPQPPAELTFEDKLKQFLSSSEGRMADLNRNIDGKRSGGRRRR
jgi:S1 RNA binding domain protein